MTLRDTYWPLFAFLTLLSYDVCASFRGQFLNLPEEATRFREKTPPLSSDGDSSVGSPLTPSVDAVSPAVTQAAPSLGVVARFEERPLDVASSEMVSTTSSSAGDGSPSCGSSDPGDLSSVIERDAPSPVPEKSLEALEKAQKVQDLQTRYHQLNKEIRDASFKTPAALTQRLQAQQALVRSQLALARTSSAADAELQILQAQWEALEFLIQGKDPTAEIFAVMTHGNQELYVHIHGALGASEAEKCVAQRRVERHLWELKDKEKRRLELQEEMRAAGFQKPVFGRSLEDLRRGLRAKSADV